MSSGKHPLGQEALAAGTIMLQAGVCHVYWENVLFPVALAVSLCRTVITQILRGGRGKCTEMHGAHRLPWPLRLAAWGTMVRGGGW